MIKIIATIVLVIMCYLIAETITYSNAPLKYWFMWGWISSVITGFLINWFVKAIEDEKID